MGKGINQEFASAIFDIEPTAILDLYILYYDYANDSQEQIYFHGGTNGLAGKIYFDGQEYLPLPIEGDSFEVLGDQRLPRPKLRISNAGLYVSSMLRKYNNLNGAKIIRRRTFVKFLDDENFPNNKNPWGSANPNAKMPDEKYFISRKTLENKMVVEFELVTSLELENINIPGREVSSRYCSWVYRGLGCRYGNESQFIGDNLDRPIGNEDDDLFVTGTVDDYKTNSRIFPIEKTGSSVDDILTASGSWATGKSYSIGDYVFLINNKAEKNQELTYNAYSNLPSYYVCKSGHSSTEQNKPTINSDLWVKDICSKKLGGCKLRFNNDSYLDGINNGKDLPYGGFPGTENFSY